MKLKRLFLGLVTMMIMTFGLTIMSYADDVSKATEIAPVDIEDFTMDTSTYPWQYDIVDSKYVEEFNEGGEAVRYFKFTLTKSAYVVIKSYHDAAYYSKEYIYLGQTNIFTENESVGNCKKLLETGTYYIKYVSEKGGNDASDPQVYLSVFKQDVERTGTTTGGSVKEAISVNNGKYGTSTAYGLLSTTYKTQWFKIDIKSKSDVKFTLTQDLKLGDSFGHACGTLYKEVDGVAEGEKIYYNWDFENFEETLDAGTYYFYTTTFCLDSVRVKMTVDIKDTYAPNTPTAKSYKSGTKYIKGNAEVGSTVYAKIGKKTYKATTDKYGVFKIKTPVLKVGNKITVYAKDSFGNKSVTTKLTVKNRKLTAPKVKTAKRNTKLVKGTAKKGLTVYVTYNGKTVKKKLTSNNYSVKVSKKLTKGAKVKVKVVDSYGNYSKTVTYKVK